MSVEQQKFLQWISEQCKSLGASPKMYDEMQTLASQIDLTPANDLQLAVPTKDTPRNLLESVQK